MKRMSKKKVEIHLLFCACFYELYEKEWCQNVHILRLISGFEVDLR